MLIATLCHCRQLCFAYSDVTLTRTLVTHVENGMDWMLSKSGKFRMALMAVQHASTVKMLRGSDIF